MTDNFEHEIIDRLGRIEEQNKEQFKRLEKTEHTLNGNGHPGLTTRVQQLEDAQEAAAKSKTNLVAWAAIGLSAISAITGLFKHG